MNRSIVVMCMGGAGHIQVLLPVIEGLHRRGCRIRVMTSTEFRQKVEAAGGEHIDLFAARPLEAVDATSIPVPSRFVTFAAVYAEAVAAEISTWRPDLIVYDTFTVIAPVVARLLDLPYVNVCPNHAPVPSRVLASLQVDPRVAISTKCQAAVERLKDVHGLRDASPFYYAQALSPFLNLYCEPRQFLAVEDHDVFEPLEFFGSLPSSAMNADATPPPRSSSGKPHVYVAFGTGVFRYFERAARAALFAIARTLAGKEMNLLVSLGGHAIAPSVRAGLESSNVRVADYVDQWSVLQETDVFITHHGINSTHESIFHGTPMLSYPFFGDQPALARRCQDLGLAVPLVESPRAAVEPDALLRAIARLTDEAAAFAARLTEARSWELRTMANRDTVFERMLAMMGERG